MIQSRVKPEINGDVSALTHSSFDGDGAMQIKYRIYLCRHPNCISKDIPQCKIVVNEESVLEEGEKNILRPFYTGCLWMYNLGVYIDISLNIRKFD